MNSYGNLGLNALFFCWLNTYCAEEVIAFQNKFVGQPINQRLYYEVSMLMEQMLLNLMPSKPGGQDIIDNYNIHANLAPPGNDPTVMQIIVGLTPKDYWTSYEREEYEQLKTMNKTKTEQ